MSIQVKLRKNDEECLSFDADYDFWSVVSHVVVGEDIYTYNVVGVGAVGYGGPRDAIVFDCYSGESNVVRVSCLDEVRNCGNVATSRDKEDSDANL